MYLIQWNGTRQKVNNKMQKSHIVSVSKDSPLDGNESFDIGVTGKRPGPSSHCFLSNRLKSTVKFQWVY